MDDTSSIRSGEETMRITREQAFMETARVWSKRSTCRRLNVGCVVVVNSRVVSHGYNGHEPGAPHCSGNDCPGMTPGMCNTTHAEVNALKHVPVGIKPEDLYVTDSPCLGCASVIVREGVKRVIFERAYRDLSGVQYLLKNGIFVYEMKPAGHIVDLQTGKFIDAITAV